MELTNPPQARHVLRKAIGILNRKDDRRLHSGLADPLRRGQFGEPRSHVVGIRHTFEVGEPVPLRGRLGIGDSCASDKGERKSK